MLFIFDVLILFAIASVGVIGVFIFCTVVDIDDDGCCTMTDVATPVAIVAVAVIHIVAAFLSLLLLLLLLIFLLLLVLLVVVVAVFVVLLLLLLLILLLILFFLCPGILATDDLGRLQSPNRLQAFFHLHWVHHCSRRSMPYTLRHFLFSPRVRRFGELGVPFDFV